LSQTDAKARKFREKTAMAGVIALDLECDPSAGRGIGPVRNLSALA
jgi:hypothetical protein